MSDDQVIRREFPAVLEPSGDGRTLDVRVVPYDKDAQVSDDGGRTWYRERWMPGVFDRQRNAANRVYVNVEHEKGFGGVVGHGVEFQDAKDGFNGTFRILPGPDGDKALALVQDGSLTGVSLEAVTLRSEQDADGVVKRLKARLLNIALCRFPAYEDAAILAVREQPDEPPPADAPAGDPPPAEVPAPVPPGEVPAPTPPGEVPAPEPPVEVPAANEVDLVLARIGFEPLVKRAVVRGPWNGAASRFDDEQWRRSCILDRGDQFDTAKTRYALPVLEPNGDLNVNAMHAAAAVLAGGRGGVNAPPAAKAAAARRLRRFYGMAGEEMPPAMMAMAGRS